MSLTEAPLTDPTPTPPNTPKRTRNGPKKSRNGPKRTQADPKRTQANLKGTDIKLSGVGRPGGSSGWGGVGVVRENENNYAIVSKKPLKQVQNENAIEAANLNTLSPFPVTKRERAQRKGKRKTKNKATCKNVKAMRSLLSQGHSDMCLVQAKGKWVPAICPKMGNGRGLFENAYFPLFGLVSPISVPLRFGHEIVRAVPVWGLDSSSGKRVLLGWHVCRTKLARNLFFELRIFSRKML